MSQIIKFANFNDNQQPSEQVQVCDLKAIQYRLHSVLIKMNQYIYKKSNISLRVSHIIQEQFIKTLLVDAYQMNYQFNITIRLIIPSFQILIQGSIIEKGRILTLPSKSLRLNFLWFLNEINKEKRNFCAFLDLENGKITVKILHSIILRHPIKNGKFQTILKTQIDQCIQYQIRIIQVLRFFQGEYPTNKKYRPIDKLSKKVSKFLSLSYLELGVSQEKGDKSPAIENYEENERKVFEQKLKTQVPSQIILQKLFYFNNFRANKKKQNEEVFLSEQEISQMEGCLKFPKPKIQHPMENQFIFNKIVINSPLNISYSPVSFDGGTSKMKIAKINFCYEQFQGRKGGAGKIKNSNIQKIVMIKIAKNQQMKRYIQHEKNVVSDLKHSSSAYIVKYYSTETDPLKGQLIMDFYQKTPNLKQYLSLHSQSLEIKSKIVLLANISNGLRFLKKKGIVHMDLNVNNILVTQNLLPKIIDFGEAYRQDRFYDEYQPGFTNPFGPPQIFSQKYFNSKQDIFSLGIIFFYVLLGKLPFEPTEKLIQNFRRKTYHKKFFFTIQSLSDIWHQESISILFSLFNQMINAECIERPYPTWTRAIFKYMQMWEQKVYSLI